MHPLIATFSLKMQLSLNLVFHTIQFDTLKIKNHYLKACI